jgi:hypothetical protein
MPASTNLYHYLLVCLFDSNCIQATMFLDQVLEMEKAPDIEWRGKNKRSLAVRRVAGEKAKTQRRTYESCSSGGKELRVAVLVFPV